MLLTVNVSDMTRLIILLHPDDAQVAGIKDGARVILQNPDTKYSAAADAVVTRKLTISGKITLDIHTAERLHVSDGDKVSISLRTKPASIQSIVKKMNGEKLSREDTAIIIKDITMGILTPEEISPYVSSMYINGLDMDETEYLAREMIETGDKLTFSQKPIVDKHSIGGVPGNKISLLVVPIIAAAHLLIPKTCSRAITGAGGTADLMEALAPVAFSAAEVQEMTEKAGGVIVWGGSTNIVPADDILIHYEYPLKINPRGKMLASILAKKKAAGADICVIDIPTGEGTKVADEVEGQILAGQLIELGKRLDMKVECAITYGGFPIGRDVGVNLEVSEALRILETGDGSTSTSLVLKSCAVAGIALEMAGVVKQGNGTDAAMNILKTGSAYQKMKEIIEIQGGNPNITSKDLPFGEFSYDIISQSSGYVISITNRAIIDIARAAGSPADHGAGIHLNKKPGETVKKGEVLFTIYAEKDWKLSAALKIAAETEPVKVSGMLISRIA
ncbi:MAG TPA: AMP phosphorylase [Methanocorpusculum sp.]|nr:AMP phosphorylase [Methanocorpusculum sp.]